MPIDPRLLEILCDPVTKVPVEPLSGARLEKLNALIAAGRVRQAGGATRSQPLAEALITRNQQTVYPVDDGIPVMLEDEGLPVAGLEF